MFNIYSIFAGWFQMSFGERQEYPAWTAPNTEIFSLSYLDAVKEELDNLFHLKHNQNKEYEFDLEGEDLLIETKRIYDQIIIKCTYIHRKEKTSYMYKCLYDRFIGDYIKEMEEHKQEYIKDFSYHDVCNWDNKHYMALKNIIK